MPGQNICCACWVEMVFQCGLHAFKVWCFFAASSVKLVPVSGSASAASAASAALGLSYVRVLRC